MKYKEPLSDAAMDARIHTLEDINELMDMDVITPQVRHSILQFLFPDTTRDRGGRVSSETDFSLQLDL